ncbi:MAG TPA: hypothetical protein VNL35_20615 [Chloroflexota bacterium]|nr:hypothetical protein [Chloroflexota bacterium]
MPDEGGFVYLLLARILRQSRRIWRRIADSRFGGPDVGSRFVLLLFGVVAMTAARAVTFIHLVPDRSLPPIPPLIWVFHLADTLFLPRMDRLPNLSTVQDVQMVALVIALGCLYLAVRSTIPAWLSRHYRPFAFAAMVIAVPLTVIDVQGISPYPAALGTHHYGNDAVTVTSCAVDSFLAGRNPYRTFRVIPCLQENGMQGPKTTPLQAGAFKHIRIYPNRTQLDSEYQEAVVHHWAFPAEFESSYSYPAASFLVPALAVALHIEDLSLIFLAFYLGIVFLVLWRARDRIARKLTLVVLAANAALWPTIESGATDALYALLVMVAWVTRDRRWLSALALGLAVASRQQAWFFLIFYAILIERTEGRRELLTRLGIIGVVFLGTNVPYMVDSPGQWFAGVLGPMRDPMFARGSGIVAASTAGGAWALPLGPRWLYGGLEALGVGASLVLYWKNCRQHPNTGLVLAPLGLFFAWRSLYSYFLPLTLLALYPAMVEYIRPRLEKTGDARRELGPRDQAA